MVETKRAIAYVGQEHLRFRTCLLKRHNLPGNASPADELPGYPRVSLSAPPRPNPRKVTLTARNVAAVSSRDLVPARVLRQVNPAEVVLVHTNPRCRWNQTSQ